MSALRPCGRLKILIWRQQRQVWRTSSTESCLRLTPRKHWLFILLPMQRAAFSTCPKSAAPFVPAKSCPCPPEGVIARCARYSWIIGVGCGPASCGATQAASLMSCASTRSRPCAFCPACLFKKKENACRTINQVLRGKMKHLSRRIISQSALPGLGRNTLGTVALSIEPS